MDRDVGKQSKPGANLDVETPAAEGIGKGTLAGRLAGEAPPTRPSPQHRRLHRPHPHPPPRKR